MCGIAGYIDRRTTAGEREPAVRRICQRLVHRGPDDDGVFSEGPATLGMRRLSIFDPAHGRQPMQTPDQRFTLVFNGSIFNFRELRDELRLLGHSFRTDCDTEVLLAAFAQWGEGCLRRLRGMFAFAAWDSREQALFFARDFLGIKPLYFSGRDGTLVFASEIQALLAGGLCSREIDRDALAGSLAHLAVAAPQTIYREIKSLRPGECGWWRDGELRIRPYWTLADAAQSHLPACSTREEFLLQLRAQLEDTVRAHTLADVPVGAFLSGGIDSAAIVGLMSRQSPQRLKTFSIDFAEPGYSESAAAADTARHFGTEHHTFVLSGGSLVRDLDTILGSFDQPSGDGINTFYASKVAHEGGVRCALSGLGADELFGGYPSFSATPRLARLVRLWAVVPSRIQSLLLRRWSAGDARQVKLVEILVHATSLQETAALQRINLTSAGRRDILAEPPPFAHHPELGALSTELAGADPFRVISGWELRTYMANVLLRDSDVMSMRHSLELRVPFVDRPLLEWFWRQPTSFKVAGRRPKSALVDALQDILPPGLVSRPKQGFTLPFALWMKQELRPFLDETFSSASVARSGFFNPAGVQARWQSFLGQEDPREWSRVWNLAMILSFINRSEAARAA